jgi:DNA-binding NarL/FixJ family response regulator
MYELPGPSQGQGQCQRQRHVDPSPLSDRERAVLLQLAKGAINKQIAHDLALSLSIVRAQLRNIYGKLGVANRAQAVLIATDRGWLSAVDWARASTGASISR